MPLINFLGWSHKFMAFGIFVENVNHTIPIGNTTNINHFKPYKI